MVELRAWSLRCRFGGPKLRNRGLKDIGFGRFRYMCGGHFTAMIAVDDGSVDIVSQVWAGFKSVGSCVEGCHRVEFPKILGPF